MSEGRRLGRVSTCERGSWLDQADIVPNGRGGGQGFRRRPYFYFVCINLHTISNNPLLTDM